MNHTAEFHSATHLAWLERNSDLLIIATCEGLFQLDLSTTRYTRIAYPWGNDEFPDKTIAASTGLAVSHMSDGTVRAWRVDGSRTWRPSRSTSDPLLDDECRLRGCCPDIVRRSHRGPEADICEVSPDGRLVATAGWDHVVQVWCLPDGTFLRRLGRERDAIVCLTVAENGRRVVAAHESGCLRSWDLRERRLAAEIRMPAALTSLATVAMGSEVLAGGVDGRIRRVRASTLDVLEESGAFMHGRSTRVAASLDGRCRAFAGGRPAERSLEGRCVVQSEAGDVPIHAVGPWGHVRGAVYDVAWSVGALAFAPDARTLAVGVGGEIRLWHTLERRWIAGFACPGNDYCARVLELCFSPDGSTLFAGVGCGLHALDARTLRRRFTVRPPADWFWSVDVSPDGRLLAVASAYDRRVGIHDARTGAVVVVRTDAEAASGAVRFTPDSSTLVSAGEGGRITVRDTRTFEVQQYLEA